MLGGCDILIVYSRDAEEWCQYLQDLFLSSRQVRSQKTLTYRLNPKTSFSAEDLSFFVPSLINHRAPSLGLKILLNTEQQEKPNCHFLFSANKEDTLFGHFTSQANAKLIPSV